VKIYTRTGDAGQTSLFGGVRVSKSDPRVDAYGDVDELNAWVGFARAAIAAGAPAAAPHVDLDAALLRIQRDLFALGAQLADPAEKISSRVAKSTLGDDDVARLEGLIDGLETELPPLRRFILPGGALGGSALHVARTVCRRAERRMIALTPSVDGVLLRYVNRLSDFLFVAARATNHQQGATETEW
jgi:cob(I)alamin adenosyltransferase